ncbi:hypothetical protein K7432_011899 [Basidiobolus ranarum]|uniref:Uncharacterized protein n=1 Tax=Basidiobolus ranarum TaxID=34480 RepID=A0ABR2WLM6_9FUNG
MIIWEQFRQVYFHLENTVAPYRSGYPGFYTVIELCQAHSELFKVPLVEYNRFHQICQIGNQMANASGGIFVFRRNFNQPNSEPLVRYEISSHVPHSTRFVVAPSFMDLGRQSQHHSWPYISAENSGFCMPPPQLQPTMQYQAQLNHIMKDSPSVPNSIFHLRQSYFQQPGYEHQNLDASNHSPTRDIAVKSALS